MATIDQLGINLEADETGLATAVEAENVYKSFGTQTVLNGVSLTVNRGETVAILGRSGTGKSVLLRMIIGLQAPDSDRSFALSRNGGDAGF